MCRLDWQEIIYLERTLRTVMINVVLLSQVCVCLILLVGVGIVLVE